MKTRDPARLLICAALLVAGPVTGVHAVEQPDQFEGLVAWYRADALQLGNGDKVAVWPDASGQGHALTDDGNGLHAVFESVQVNNLPAVRIRKGNSHSVTDPFELGDHTIFVVYRSKNPSRALLRDPANEFSGILLGSERLHHQLRYGSLKSATYGTFSQDTRSFSITVLGRYAGVMKAFINNNDVSTGGEHSSPVGVGKFFALSLTRFARSDGDGMSVAEILIYNRYLADQERDEVTRYLAEKYAIEAEQIDPAAEAAPELVAAALPAGLVQLSTTPKINVNEALVAIPWDRQDELDPPFEHDIENQNTRLVCTRDDTRVRLYVSLPLSASVDGVNVRVLFRVNGALFLRGEGRSGLFGGTEGAAKGSVQAEVITTLSAGDYVEVVTLKAGAAGTVSVDPDEAVLIAEVK
jgi:hypothetical protein